MRSHEPNWAPVTVPIPTPDWRSWSRLSPEGLDCAVQAVVDEMQSGQSLDDVDVAMSQVPPVLRTHWLLDWLRYEVLQGGFVSYLENSHGRYADETVEALREIGASATADLLRAAIALHAGPGRHPGPDLEGAFYADDEGWEAKWMDHLVRRVAELADSQSD